MNDYDDPLAMPWLHIKPSAAPAPTPADPAARRHVRHIGGGMLAWFDGDTQAREIGPTPGWDFRDRDEFIVAVNRRDAAPALLAEVEAAKAAATRWEKWYHESCDVTREWIASNNALHARSLEAERALAGAVGLTQGAADWVRLAAHGDNCWLHDTGEFARCFCGRDSLVEALDDFLAHHGAGTGESDHG